MRRDRVSALRGTRSRIARLLAGSAVVVGLAVLTWGGSAWASVAGLFGSLPSAGTPAKGGTISVGFLTGSTPLTIFPITGATQSSVYTSFGFQYDFFVPLYNGPVGANQEIDYAVSLATKPVFSNGGKTVTVPMKQGY